MPLFDTVADAYDQARPGYPAEIFDTLEPLAGLRVLDAGAGTGIATRELRKRDASVVALDVGSEVLARARARTPDLHAVVADGGSIPLRDGSIDLVTCAQSWHWFDAAASTKEFARVLAPSGSWAAWWSQVRADGEPWFERHVSVIEDTFPGVRREQADIDWGDRMEAGGLFKVVERLTVPWVRHVFVEDWRRDLSSHSYVAELDPPRQLELLDRLQDAAIGGFPDGQMTIACDTTIWIARVVRLRR